MKTNLIFVLLMSVCCYATKTVLICDPNTLNPIDSTIMVGKTVGVLVRSDANDLWSGGLFINRSDWSSGYLTGLNKDPNSRDYIGSHLADAGTEASVFSWRDSEIRGYEFHTDVRLHQAGHWFFVTYTAALQGSCSLQFYDYGYSWTKPDPNNVIVMQNIPTRDFNNDDKVSLADFDLFSRQWLCSTCSEPNWCEGADINHSGTVDIEDVCLLSDYWLWGTPNWHPPVKADPVEPNLTYLVCDANGLSEVTLNVGDSVRLYIDMTPLSEEVHLFNMEVNISEPNLGSIDHSSYDPNNPSDTLPQILAKPRLEAFDYWGPGSVQLQGIRYLAVSIQEPFITSRLASFVYTATAAGDVQLTLINSGSKAAKVRPILIHQIDSVAQLSSSAESAAVTITDPNSIAELAESAQTRWETSEDLQNNISEEKWQSFIECLEEAAEVESENE